MPHEFSLFFNKIESLNLWKFRGPEIFWDRYYTFLDRAPKYGKV
jgi:hypothetical protein